jgi:dephospho-CoA kinase
MEGNEHVHGGKGQGTKKGAAGKGGKASRPPVPVIGLVGGIGSGKSQAAAAFARRGARVISGDELGHAALRVPELREEIVARWGSRLLDDNGEIRRSLLGQIVFADPDERRALEKIVHPWIKRRLREEVAAARADPMVPFVVVDAAVLLEAGWDEVCDRLVFVFAPPEERLRRLAQRRGWTREDVLDRERAQLPLTEKAVRTEYRLDNTTTLDNLERQVDNLLTLWGLAYSSESSCHPDTGPSLDNITFGSL